MNLNNIDMKELPNLRTKIEKFENDIIENKIFEDELEIYKLKNNIKFKDCKFKNFIIFKNCRNKIKFENCEIHKISFYSIDGESVFNNCKIEILSIEDSKKTKKIEFEKSEIQKFVSVNSCIEKLNFQMNSFCDSCEFKKSSKVDDFIISNSVISKLYSENFIRINIKSNGKIEKYFTNKIDYQQIREYINSAFKEKNRQHSISSLKYNYMLTNAIYLAAKDSNNFVQSDNCLCFIRKLNSLIYIKENKSIFKKIFGFLNIAILQTVFGWGIKITNNIISAIVVMVIFAILYNNFSKLNFIQSLEISINRFFNISDNNIKILPIFDTSENIIGIILLAIITSVLVRKIIR